jgi:probable HAF family extracellular repeat protein
MVGLGDFPGGDFFSLAYQVSGDGTVVVGMGSTAQGFEPFIWNQVHGMRRLHDVLTQDFGLDLTGWVLFEARGISADGRTIVGTGTNPSGNTEAWIAHLGCAQTPGQGDVCGPTRGLGDLPGGDFYSAAYGVSADGTVVVGDSTAALGGEAFRWTRAGGMVGLGDLPGGDFSSRAYGVSGDGTVVVGESTSASGNTAAFRWTAQDGMVSVGGLPGHAFSVATAVSADGTVVVGHSSTDAGPGEAFRWTAAEGIVGLGILPGGASSQAYGVAGDGTVVVGASSTAQGYEAFRWTAQEGIVGLGHLGAPGGRFFSGAYGVSADGTVIVGQSLTAAGNSEAFRWTAAGGMVGLGDLPGGPFNSQAHGISGDGTLVVGTSITAQGQEAFLWDQAHGMRRLHDVLTQDFGLDLTGWWLEDARAISADGRTIVGTGFNPAHVAEAWIAHLGCVPGQGDTCAPTAEVLSAQDSFLRAGAHNTNEGANPRLHLQGAGNNRVVVAFDLTGVHLARVTSATLILTIIDNGGNWGAQGNRTVSAHPLLAAFVEGNGKTAEVPPAEATRGTGLGVTWTCATDIEIANRRAECGPAWTGGAFGPATAPPVVHVNGQLGEVRWEVTADVLAGVTGWLIKKTNEAQAGRVAYSAKEGLAPPRLLLTLE